ncbi:hypothetical protein FB107DRAFT_193132, partial [Schizophyllum commune]
FHEGLKRYRASLKLALSRLVDDKARLGTWGLAKDVDQTHASHVKNLSLPHVKGLETTPSLLLHGLGNRCGDPTLEPRLHEVFGENHAYICNASGSGKTRLLLEGLCMHWGLYLTCVTTKHGIGSADLEAAIRNIEGAREFHSTLDRDEPTYDLQDNIGTVRQHILCLLYARMFVLKTFLDCLPHSHWTPDAEKEYRLKWLTLQLDPTILVTTKDSFSSRDVFVDLMNLVHTTCPILSLDEQLLTLTTEILPHPAGGGRCRPNFYVVLDEVQTVVSKHRGSFFSDERTMTYPRSLFRQVVATLKKALSVGAYIIPTGTNLSAAELHEAVGSTLNLPVEEHRTQHTGGFDTLPSIYRYSKIYFPPTMQSGDACKRLIWRMGIWLVGRHRFVAGYLVRLLRNGFASPHRVLNAYVRQHTGIYPSDAGDCIQYEKPLPLSQIASYEDETMLKDINWAALSHNDSTHNLVYGQIREVVFGRLLRSSQNICLSSTQARDMVQLGFARYIPGDDSNVVVISEPLVLLRLAEQMDDLPRSCTYNFLAENIMKKSAENNGWENFVAHSFTRLFSAKKKRLLSDIFDLRQVKTRLPNGKIAWMDDAKFAGLMSLSGTIVAAVRGWDNKLLTIGELIDDHRPGVSSYAPGDGPQRLRPTCNSGQRADDVTAVLRWFRENSSPILFPNNLMGPDIVFLLRLSNGELMWMVVQCKIDTPQALTFRSSSKITNGAVRSITPEFFFIPNEKGQPQGKPLKRRDVVLQRMNLPGRTNLAGKHGVLRVIACFPSVVPLNEMADPDTGGHPLVMLNCSKLQDAFQDMEPR